MRTLAACALLVAGCKSADPILDEPSEPAPNTTGSAGGFSASLSAELGDVDSSGTAGAPEAAPADASAESEASAPPVAAGSAAGAEPRRPAKPPVEVPEELRAIQLEMLPNWDRDVEAAGTISRFITVHSRNQEALFVFHYGYDEPGAPTDREAYKAFLADRKILRVTTDRQRGAAWFLEGTDRSGKPAFRFLVSYGGKRLVCYGSLYKQSPLGDIRDEVVNEAQKICESLTL